MKTIILKASTVKAFLEARAFLGDLHIEYVIGEEEIAGEYFDEKVRYVIFSVFSVRWYFLKKRFEKEIDKGAEFSIIETF